MQQFDDPAGYRIQFACSPVTAQPLTAMGIEVFGHGGAARLVGLSADGNGGVSLRTIRVLGNVDESQTDTTSKVTFHRSLVDASRGNHALDTMRAALVASIHKGAPSNNGSPSESMTMTTSRVSLELYLRDAAGGHVGRAYSGYAGSFRAVERVPVSVAWQALTDLAPVEASQDTAEPLDRDLLFKVWSQTRQRPWFAERALLQMAKAAGSPRLIPLIVPALDSDEPQMQQLAVAALAAITGWDARRDANGVERPWPDVVSDYARECSRD